MSSVDGKTALGLDEFGLIETYFRPLAEGEGGALSLLDDAALLHVPEGLDLVVATDMVVAGVHFLPDCAPDRIAAKALAVNLSDLAAMGAEARWYSLGLSLPGDVSADWLRGFAKGLNAAQTIHGVSLIGGDTTKTSDGLTISITVHGTVPRGGAVRRAGARPGDALCASGTIGDAYLGLLARTGSLDADADWVVDAYEKPEPRLSLGRSLREIATAMTDVSDGLIADARHVAQASKVDVILDITRIPLSATARNWINAQPDPEKAMISLMTGGDDYELIFSVPRSNRARLAELSKFAGPSITAIGRIAAGSGSVLVCGGDGSPINIPRNLGYGHF